MTELIEDVVAGDHAALARAITTIENRRDGYRDLVADLHEHAGDADVIGITGPPGAGKSTLVDQLARAYRERGETVGVLAIDPASPFTGGAILGDRIRMASNTGDMEVFFRSMSARGTLGGLAAATGDAVTALDAFGKDKVVIETVGAGQNEIDVVRMADTVAVLVPPGSGDAIQTLKAGILEIADVFVVNKADREGVDRLVADLRDLIAEGRPGSHRVETPGDPRTPEDAGETWEPRIVETVATEGSGLDDLIDALDDHAAFLDASGLREAKRRTRHAETIRTLLREDLAELAESEIDARGGIDALVDPVLAGESDPYSVVDEVIDPIATCIEGRRDHENELDE